MKPSGYPFPSASLSVTASSAFSNRTASLFKGGEYFGADPLDFTVVNGAGVKDTDASIKEVLYNEQGLVAALGGAAFGTYG